jgi:SAM-dependent methyltransferase|tara:strand:- start:27 stop:950 length:924 start_codon:yes stop_codon:yes gene_type:complete
MPLPKLSNHIFKLISVKSAFQKKKILNFHKTLARKDLIENEKYLQIYNNFLKKNNISISSAVDSYIEMCTDMFSCHIKFLRTGKYPVYDVKEARRKVYNNHKKMKSYMVGLAISQFFWKTHYKMFKHLQFFVKNSKSFKSYLEIGPGHGLFSYYSYENLKNLKNFHIIDISKTSLNLTKIFLSSFFKKKKVNIKYILGDFLKKKIDMKYDIIVCGEVLEHVSDPIKFMKKIHYHLNNKGKVFISTCINCPAIDHVNQWYNIEEIRKIFKKSKLNLLNDKVLPVEKVSYNKALKNKITVNYSAILQKI